uniref:Uncharacterized protein n=1 Tax=Glossina brevipalpis TaxID=37001 RepID=A0A1A9WXZ8_9MUSC
MEKISEEYELFTPLSCLLIWFGFAASTYILQLKPRSERVESGIQYRNYMSALKNGTETQIFQIERSFVCLVLNRILSIFSITQYITEYLVISIYGSASSPAESSCLRIPNQIPTILNSNKTIKKNAFVIIENAIVRNLFIKMN